MTEFVIYIGGNAEMEGKVLSRDGNVLTVELADGSVVRRHEANFVVVSELIAPLSTPVYDAITAPRKRGRPKKHV